MICSAVSVHLPESHWSHCGFAAQSPSICWRIYCESTETTDYCEPTEIVLQIQKVFNRMKIFARRQLLCECTQTHCKCVETARRLRKLKNALFAVESQSKSPKGKRATRISLQKASDIEVLLEVLR